MKKVDLYSIRKELASGKSIFDMELYVTWYSRVSTDKEAQLHSLQNQIDYYNKFIKSVPNWHFVEGYYDEGISGKSAEKRDGFLRMIDDGMNGKFNLIITKELSRFARNTVESIQYTRNLLNNNVGIFFESDAINTFLPDMDFKLTIMSGMAQDELRKLSERVRFGFKSSIEKGVVLGNDVIWGYKKDNGKLVIDEEEAKIVRKIFEMYADNKGFRVIGEELKKQGYYNRKGNPFSYSTLSGIIKNVKYKGYYCGHKSEKIDYMLDKIKHIDEKDWIVYKDYEKVPPIVSEELWNKANDIYKKKSIKNLYPNISFCGRYPYSGKIICGEHNVAYQRTVFRGKYGEKELWECKNYKDKGTKGCNTAHIYTSELNEILKTIFEDIVKNKNEIVFELIKLYKEIFEETDIQKSIDKYKYKLDDLKRKKDLLLDLLLKARIGEEEFSKRNNEFNSQIKEYESRVNDLIRERDKTEDLSKKAEFLRSAIEKKMEFDNGIDTAVIDNILEKIIVNRTDDDKVVDLDIYLKVAEKNIQCYLIKDGKKFSFKFHNTKDFTSVCY